MVIMFYNQLSLGSVRGNVAALLSAFTFSFYFIFMRRQKGNSTIEPILLSHIFAVLFCAVIVFFVPAPRWSLPAFLAVGILGIFQIGVTSLLFAAAIKRISALPAMLIGVIEPVFNPLWVFWVLGEKPGANVIIGGIIIILTATFSSVISAQRKTPNAA
jgi:drug/metabolite transporter (DMT)-like permease